MCFSRSANMYLQMASLVVRWLRICRQCRRQGSNLCSGETAHAAGQLTRMPLLTPVRPEPTLGQKEATT